MADMMIPQTPPRKLFKPSSKTKTPTPAKKQAPTTPTHSSTQSNQSHDTFTPTDTVSRNADVPGSLSRGTSEAAKGAADSSRGGEKKFKGLNNAAKSIAGKPLEILDSATSELPEPSNPTDSLNSPTDIAKYFIDQGHPEMSNFISALAGKTSESPEAIDDCKESGNVPGDTADMTSNTTPRPASGASEPIKQLPRDDALITSPNERTKEAVEKAVADTTSRATTKPSSGASVSMKELPRDDALIISPNERTKEAIEGAVNDATQKASDTTNGIETLKEKGGAPNGAAHRNQSNAPKPADVSKEAEGSTNATKDQIADILSINIAGEPDTTNISKDAQVGVSPKKDQTNGSAHEPLSATGQKATNATSDDTNDGTQVADNMGKPAHIERRIEIPLPRPEKVVNSPPAPGKHDAQNITNGLRSTDDLPSTQDLPSTDNLPEISDYDTQQDPPEEILDPSVHSPSSNITPIPKIPKITPIGIPPPPNLEHLARGLGGNTVDDVGNIVDDAGKILGHATGDLPAMVGRKVADNGEVYGDDGEVVGYVSENFTEPPEPVDLPEKVLGGLKIDHDGNILDANGNIIGRFNEKAGENSTLAPFLNRQKSRNPKTDGKPQEEKKPKVNAHTGGSPSDLFLDVKSTNDGIQLTIRIPTTFGRQSQD